MRTTADEVVIVECTAPDELCHWYHGEHGPQPVVIALDLENGWLRARVDPEVGGNAIPVEVAHGFVRWYGIPLLTGDAANALMEEIRPLAQRVVDGTAIVWNDQNMVVELDDDAEEAEEEIGQRLGQEEDEGPNTLPVCDVYEIGEVWTAEEAGITALTTDVELQAIGERLLAEYREGQEEPDLVINDLDVYLKGLCDELVAAAADDGE